MHTDSENKTAGIVEQHALGNKQFVPKFVGHGALGNKLGNKDVCPNSVLWFFGGATMRYSQ